MGRKKKNLSVPQATGDVLFHFEPKNESQRKVAENYYEVYCESDGHSSNESIKTRVPVARFPIANTNMLIVK